MRIEGRVKKGHGIATYTIEKQKPFFKTKIPDIDRIRTGTINLDLAPKILKVKNFDFYFQDINWDKNYPIENFGLIFIKKIIVDSRIHINPGFLYFSNKSPHVSNLSQVEIIAEQIDGISYNTEITVDIDENYIELL